MKKFSKILIVAMVIVALSFCFAACDKTPNVDPVGTVTIVIDGETPTEYSVGLSNVTVDNGLMSILDYLKANEELTYTSLDSGYGAYLTQVNGLQENASNGTYLFIYTSVQDDIDVSTYATTKEYKGVSYTSSGVGASQMHFVDGAVIIISTITY